MAANALTLAHGIRHLVTIVDRHGNTGGMFTLAIDDSGIARIRIDRPDARNAVTVAGWARLTACVAEAGRASARVVLLHAAPGAIFCAGADLKELAALGDAVHARAPFRHAMAAAFAGIRALPMPTIAVIERGCYGAGVALAMACDLRIATPDAHFAVPPAKLGILYPDDDVRRLTALVGEGQAIRLLASGDAIDAREAARIGLVDMLADDPLVEAEGLAGRIAGNAAASVRGLKAFVRGNGAADAFDASFDTPAFARWAAAR